MRGTIGRPVAGAADGATALACLCVIFVVLGLIVVQVALQSSPAEASTVRQLASAMAGPSTVSRPRLGAVAPASQSAPAEVAPASAVDGTVRSGGDALASPPPDPAPAAIQTGARARVANTDNLGVVLRTAPKIEARVPRGLLEGAAVTVLDRADSEWAHVRADNGQQGWVPIRYLAPAE
jgi:hypothetical protein